MIFLFPSWDMLVSWRVCDFGPNFPTEFKCQFVICWYFPLGDIFGHKKPSCGVVTNPRREVGEGWISTESRLRTMEGAKRIV